MSREIFSAKEKFPNLRLSNLIPNTHTHTRIHTRTHTRIHTRTHTNTHVCIRRTYLGERSCRVHERKDEEKGQQEVDGGEKTVLLVRRIRKSLQTEDRDGGRTKAS